MARPVSAGAPPRERAHERGVEVDEETEQQIEEAHDIPRLLVNAPRPTGSLPLGPSWELKA